MADSTEQWPTLLDEQSFGYLVDLSQNLSKVEGLVKKLVKGEYQQWYKKQYESTRDSQNFTSAENNSWDNCLNSQGESEDNDDSYPTSYKWYPTREASSENANNPKSEWTERRDEGWEIEPDWSSVESKNETTMNWPAPKVSEWDEAHLESEWRNFDSKESNQEEIEWE
ncbi:uncharacterized protein LOC107367777 [Tetranychus urticae]|uniref:Uncharacterized protein n=1 Tax=Tetranychus urticae TaxID=32264 RepID=T1KVS7_TETUR|nr:uncharacterized protein LOC107367777 [Tetranychus urticae]